MNSLLGELQIEQINFKISNYVNKLTANPHISQYKLLSFQSSGEFLNPGDDFSSEVIFLSGTDLLKILATINPSITPSSPIREIKTIIDIWNCQKYAFTVTTSVF